MSARYSNSPALRLRIGESRLRNRLYLGLCIASFYALFLIYRDGYTGIAISLIFPTSVMLWRLRRPGSPGATLCWQQGVWTLQDDHQDRHQSRLIALGVRSTVLSWVIYIPFTGLPGGRKESLWIFPDSLPGEHWRRLRARLNLEPHHRAR